MRHARTHPRRGRRRRPGLRRVDLAAAGSQPAGIAVSTRRTHQEQPTGISSSLKSYFGWWSLAVSPLPTKMHGAGAGVQHEGEVLGAHHRRGVGVDAGRADDLGGDAGGEVGLGRRVGGDRVVALVVDLAPRRRGRGRWPRRSRGMPRLDQVAHLGVEGAGGAAQLDALGDDVAGVARAAGSSSPRRRRPSAGRGCGRRSTGAPARSALAATTGSTVLCGWAAWPPRPVTTMVNMSEAASIGPGRTAKSPTGEARHVVQAVDLLDAEALHQPVLDHLAAAAAAFLGRLEDDDGGAVEVPGLGEVLRGAEQHRGVAVVAAGVHRAGGGRGVGEAGRLAASAARPCRRAARSPGPSRWRGRGSPRRRRCGRGRSTTSSQPKPRSLSATSALVRWVSNSTSGWAWMSRRHSAIGRGEVGDAVDDGHGRLLQAARRSIRRRTKALPAASWASVMNSSGWCAWAIEPGPQITVERPRPWKWPASVW